MSPASRARGPLVLCLLALLGGLSPFGFAQEVDRPGLPGTPPGGVAPLVPQQVPQGTILEPKDPARVIGTFELQGASRSVTEGELYAAYLLLKPQREKPNQPMRREAVIEHLLLVAEATAMGCLPGDEEMAELHPLRGRDPGMADQIRARWKAMGITEADQLRYVRETKAIERMQMLFANATRVTSEEVYDLWKRDNLLFKVAYVPFPAKRYEEQLRRTPLDETVLKEFFNTNTQVQALFRRPNSVAGEILVFDPSKVTERDIQLALSRRGTPISRDEAVAYFNRNRDRLMNQIPSAERPRLYPKEPPPVGEIVTPFAILKDQIERELLLGDRIGAAFEDARKSQPWNGEALAKKHGLQLVRIQDATREELSESHPELGYQLFQNLFASEMGSVGEKVFQHEGLQFFWFVSDKKISTLPAYSVAVERGLAEEYIKFEASAKAKTDADAMMQEITDLAARELVAEEQKIRDDVKKQLDDAVNASTDKSEDARRALATRFNAQEAARINQLRVQQRSKYFDQFVRSRGIDLVELGPFVFKNTAVDRSTLTDEKELVDSFINTNYAVRALQPGQITNVLTDVVTRSHFIVQLTSRDDPPFEQMSDVEYYQRKTQLERQKSYGIAYNWNFMRLRMRLNWQDQ